MAVCQDINRWSDEENSISELDENCSVDRGNEENEPNDVMPMLAQRRTIKLWELFRFSTWVDCVSLIMGALCAFASGASTPLFMYFYGQLITQVYTEQNEAVQSMTERFAILMVCMGSMTCVLSLIYNSVYLIFSSRTAARLKYAFFSSVINQDISWHDKHKPGELISRLLADVNLVLNGINDRFANGVQNLGVFILGLSISFLTCWQVALVIFASFPLVAFFAAILIPATMRLAGAARDEYAKANSVATEIIENIKTVQIFNKEAFEVDRFALSALESRGTGIRKEFMGSMVGGMTFGVTLTALGCSFILGSYLVVAGKTNSGGVATSVLALLYGASGIGEFFPALISLNEARAAASPLYEIIDHKPQIRVNDYGVKHHVERCIEFRDVTFSYESRPDEYVFLDFNIVIRCGTKIAFTGQTGCGKSTLLALLQRFYDPLRGGIYVDGIDLRELSLQQWRSQIGVVEQEPSLFSGTVFNNVRMGKPTATLEEVIRACKRARIHDTIVQLPKQYETSIGAIGSQLSGGQKQRIAIARALLRDVRLLLLDEATSALDRVSEIQVQAAIDDITNDTPITVITIAHRLSTIRNMDCIYHLENDGAGTYISEFGTFDELWERNGKFTDMIKLQGGWSKLNAAPITTQFSRIENDIDEHKAVPFTEYHNKECVKFHSASTTAGNRNNNNNNNSDNIDNNNSGSSSSSSSSSHSNSSSCDSNRKRFGTNNKSSYNHFPYRRRCTAYSSCNTNNNNSSRRSVVSDILSKEVNDNNSMELLQERKKMQSSQQVLVSMQTDKRHKKHELGSKRLKNSPMNYDADDEICDDNLTSFNKASDVPFEMRTRWEEQRTKLSLLRLFVVGKKELWAILLGLIGSFITALIIPLGAMFITQLISILGIFQQDHDANKMRRAMWLYVGLFWALGALAFIGSVLTAFYGYAGEHLTYKLRTILFEQIVRQDQTFFDMPARDPGSLTSILAGECEAVHQLYGPALGSRLKAIVMLIAGLTIGLLIQWKVALVAFSTMPLLFTGAMLQQIFFYDSSQRNEKSKLDVVINESFSSIRTVHNCNIINRITNEFAELLNREQFSVERRCLLISVLSSLFDFVNSATVGLTYWYGGTLVANGEATFGNVMVATIAVMMASSSAGAEAGGFAIKMRAARKAACKVFSIIDRVPSVDSYRAGTMDIGDGCDIYFNNVTFNYPARAGTCVIDEFNASFHSGHSTGVVGQTGCGKSTIVQLLSCCYRPCSGAITVNGYDLATLDVVTWRSNLSIVLQEPALFSGTIRDNICYSLPEATNDEIIAAARLACIHEDIMTFNKGYETEVGYHGRGLSGGQKQRVAIARAVIRCPRLLLLDEATSALDSQTEAVVSYNLKKYQEEFGVTIVSIAHRLSTIEHCNQIMLLVDGKVVESGTHQELMALNGEYCARWHLSQR